MPALLTIAVTSYLLGSIPFGYVLVRIFRGEDVRQSGSGNIGATNVSRKSPALGVLTLLLDALKGSAAVILAPVVIARMAAGGSSDSPATAAASLAAFFAVLGHMFPVWLKFRGGKGVATGLGCFVIIAPKSVLIAACIFALIVAISRYVSLASIVAVAAFPLLAYKMQPAENTKTSLAFMAVTSLLIVARHHQNIGRLLAGTESRVGATRQ